VIDPIIATPHLGYEIDDWFINGSAAGWDAKQITLATGDRDLAVHVTFKRITNLVHITVSSGGTLQPVGNNESHPVPWGSSVSFTATAESGYHVDAWSVDNTIVQVGGNDFRLVAVTVEHWLRVDFAKDTYSILGKTTPHGTILPGGVVFVARGDNHSFSGVPDEGYTLAGWMLDDAIVQTEPNDYVLVNVQTNHTVKALFGLPILDCRPVTNRLSSPAESDVWWFTAKGGEQTQFQLSQVLAEGEWTPFIPTLELYGPDGKLVAPRLFGSANQLTLTNAGTYLLLVHDYAYETNGNYVLEVRSPSCPMSPQLSITTEGNMITVSWKAPAEGWVLERGNSLSSTSIPWQEVSPPYQTENGRFLATFANSPSMNSHYFRLRKP
jgi:hypothetical protein